MVVRGPVRQPGGPRNVSGWTGGLRDCRHSHGPPLLTVWVLMEGPRASVAGSQRVHRPMRHSLESLVQPWEAPATSRPQGPLPATSTRLALTPNQSRCWPGADKCPQFHLQRPGACYEASERDPLRARRAVFLGLCGPKGHWGSPRAP